MTAIIGNDILPLFELEALGEGRFRSNLFDINRQGRVFGGQLLGQAAAAAAQRCVDGRTLSYFHCMFLRGASGDRPLDYRVETMQEGRRFVTYRILGTQGEKAVIDAHATFQVTERGFEHELPLADAVPPPEECLSIDELEQVYAKELAAADYHILEKQTLRVRFVAPERFMLHPADEPKLAFWIRSRQSVPDPAQGALTALYLSDYFVGLSTVSHHKPMIGARNDVYVASLNHSFWLHRPCPVDDWLLMVVESPSAGSGRGLSQGRFYRRDGSLVASFAQEGSFTRKEPAEIPPQ